MRKGVCRLWAFKALDLPLLWLSDETSYPGACLL